MLQQNTYSQQGQGVHKLIMHTFFKNAELVFRQGRLNIAEAMCSKCADGHRSRAQKRCGLKDFFRLHTLLCGETSIRLCPAKVNILPQTPVKN